MRDMQAQMKVMEESFARRLKSELEHNERKLDQKIDLLHRGGHFGRKTKHTFSQAESSNTSLESSIDSRELEESDDSQAFASAKEFEDSTVQTQQRPDDLGLFEHDERSARETDEVSSSTEAADGIDERLRHSSDDSDPDEYLPPSSNLSASGPDSNPSNDSEDSLDFLSPRKRASRQAAISTLSADMDKFSFHSFQSKS